MDRMFVRIVFVSLLFAAGCGGEKKSVVRAPAEGGKLVYVTKPTDPPYTYIDEKTKDYAGVEVEIVR